MIIAIFAPFISPYPPLRTLVGTPFTAPTFSGPHPFGTNSLGKDVFSNLLHGARVSFLVGFGAAGIAVLIGLTVGMFAGFYGGFVDEVLMRFTEFVFVIPAFVLGLILVSFYGASIYTVIFVIAVLTWPGTARLARAEFASLKEREFVEAARAVGVGNLKIMLAEILPNALPPIIVNFTLSTGFAILFEAGLSFLGFGDPNVTSWGRMLQEAQRFITRAWWLAFFPGLLIFLTVLSMSLVGDGLNDALNPRLKEG